MESIAQTNVQLYNQLRHAGHPPEDLILVHRAYQLAVRLYSGCFQSDGKPVVTHVAGVASVVAYLGLPVEIIAAACVHNIYGNGDFGDGRKNCVTPYRRRVVQDAVGPDVETCIAQFQQLRFNQQTVLEISKRLDVLSVVDRELIIIELADILEKYSEGILYYGYHHIMDLVDNHAELLIEIAQRLGYPQLGTALREAFVVAAADSVPATLTSVVDQPYMKLVIPRSCCLRPAVIVRRKMSGVVHRARKALGLRT